MAGAVYCPRRIVLEKVSSPSMVGAVFRGSHNSTYLTRLWDSGPESSSKNDIASIRRLAGYSAFEICSDLPPGPNAKTVPLFHGGLPCRKSIIFD